jgi:glutathione peroxidase
VKRTLLLLAVVACSKKEAAKDPQPQPEPAKPVVAAKPAAPAAEELTPDMFDPAKLPAPGTAPAAAALTKELDPMWNVPIKTLKGEPTTLAAYKGKALMLVNVASQCGNTPQYATLEALQKKYEPKGFTVIGFPCNQFGGQEPGTAQEISTFCATHYGITFPIMEKIEVNGSARSPIYQALTQVADASGHTGDIRWNFEKFVVSADGKKITRFSPKTKPEDPTVIAAVEQALPAAK